MAALPYPFDTFEDADGTVRRVCTIAPVSCGTTFTPTLCPPAYPAPPAGEVARALLRGRTSRPRVIVPAEVPVAAVQSLPITECAPAFTPILCAPVCPAAPAVLVTARILTHVVHRRRRQSAPRVYARAQGALRSGGVGVEDIPTGATFMNIPCAPVCPADPIPAPATCQAPLGLFQLGASCLGAGEPLLTAAIRRRVARARRH